MLEAVAEDIQQPVHLTGIVEGGNELPDRLAATDFFKAFPLSRLCPLHEGNEGIDIQAGLRVIAIGGLGIPSLGRNEEGFDVRFKAFFGGFHVNNHPLIFLQYKNRILSNPRSDSLFNIVIISDSSTTILL